MTNEYPIKCLDCGLHFTVWSWDTDWHEKHTAHCPECGCNEHFIGFPKRTHPEQIYSFVPGAMDQPIEREPGSTTINYS